MGHAGGTSPRTPRGRHRNRPRHQRQRQRQRAADVVEWSVTWLAAKTRISADQRRRYRRQLDARILPAIGQLHLDEVTGTDFAELLNTLATDLKPGTVTRYYACIHAMFAYAVTEKKIDDNPSKPTDFIRDMIADDDTEALAEEHVYLTHEEYAGIRANLARPPCRSSNTSPGPVPASARRPPRTSTPSSRLGGRPASTPPGRRGSRRGRGTRTTSARTAVRRAGPGPGWRASAPAVAA
jgi:hypothetical protein